MPNATINLCSVDGCDRPFIARGYCKKHYQRFKKFGTTDLPKKRPKNSGPCPAEGCDRQQEIGGMCTKHYQRRRRTGTTDPRPPKTPAYCEFSGCPRVQYGKGYCHAHWRQLNRGEELRPLYGSMLPLEERLTVSINKTATCWLWARPLNDDGYATIVVDGVFWFAHRYMYTEHVGPIPEGLEIDHRCHVKHCVNPKHLRPVTRKQNIEHKNGAQKNSTTGVLGVFPLGYGRYGTQVKHHGKAYSAGNFATIDEADVAVRELRKSLFTHDDFTY